MSAPGSERWVDAARGTATSGRVGRGRGVATSLLVTCEHGGHRSPAPYRALFDGLDGLLASHRGWDPGALGMARSLAHSLGAPLHFSVNTRLLVDPNRSPHNPAVFSEVTRGLAVEERRRILESFHTPYRRAVAGGVEEALSGGGRVLHLSVHTFTPFMNGAVRKTDIGLLYDPARLAERELVGSWVAELKGRLPGSNVRRNHPYRGATDGLTTWLRKLHPPERYLGVEIEVSQRLLDGRNRVPARIVGALAEGAVEGLHQSSLR